jgi:hypothetical protein
MNAISTNANGRCDALVEALKAEFGSILAERIVEAEAADFLWEARVRERYLGQQSELFCEGGETFAEVSRIAVLSLIDGGWMVGTCLVDGEGMVLDLLWKQQFRAQGEAELAFVQAR